ncbi:MAG: AAA family ATPase [Leptolyngbya sp. BL-A-14]
MSQSNLAVQQPEGEPTPLQAQPREVDKSSPASGISVPKLGRQKERSPELQAEVERIGLIEPFVGLQRDEDLFTNLNHWSDLHICARIITMDRLGLVKSLKFYTQSQTKRRSGLLVTPAPVAYVEIEQNGSPTNLLLSILEFLVNPIDCGNLRQLRSRTWGTLKAYKVKILIVNNADLLSYAAFNELMRITEKLKISVVLGGSPCLNEILDPKALKKGKYINIHNTFLKWQPYSILSYDDIKTVITEWEKSLNWPQPLNLWTNTEIVKKLDTTSQGQLRALYENLREIAVWKLDNPKAQINSKNISKALSNGYHPISKLQNSTVS